MESKDMTGEKASIFLCGIGSVLAVFLGLGSLTAATQGVGLICVAVLLAIDVRIIQARVQHARVLEELQAIRNSKT